MNRRASEHDPLRRACRSRRLAVDLSRLLTPHRVLPAGPSSQVDTQEMASSLLPTYSQSRNPVTTEWDDIQRRIGNLPELEVSAPAPAWVSEDVTSQRVRERLGSAHPDQPGGSDDASADSDVLEGLRMKILREMKGEARQFGSIIGITNAEFISEVNRAGEEMGVVVFLFKQRHYHSQYMRVLLEKLARKFKHVKFCQIGHDDCIPGYPDTNLPTLLMYKNDDLVRQTVGVNALGGAGYGIDDIEWEIAEAGFVQTELPRNPHAQRHR